LAISLSTYSPQWPGDAQQLMEWARPEDEARHEGWRVGEKSGESNRDGTQAGKIETPSHKPPPPPGTWFEWG
jgi:hypothetical protein